MTHPLNPEQVKRLVRAKVVKGRCEMCDRTVNDGCSYVDCPHRRVRVYAPRTDGGTPPRHSPGSYDWSNDE